MAAAAAVDLTANVGEVPIDGNAGVPPPEMEPQTGGLQTGIPGPPGIAPPLDPNNPNMPMMAFMQLMNQQMQTFMQSMQTQMQSQTAQTNSNSGSVQNRLDEPMLPTTGTPLQQMR